MNIVIRAAQSPADFRMVRSLIDQMAPWDAAMSKAAGFSSQDVFAAYYSETADELRANLTRPRTAMLLATLDGIPAGCLGYDQFAETMAEVQKFFVLDEARGRGIGSRLLAALMARMTEDNYSGACLETATFMTDAIGLYSRAGFQKCRPFRPAPTGMTTLSVFMDRTL